MFSSYVSPTLLGKLLASATTHPTIKGLQTGQPGQQKALATETEASLNFITDIHRETSVELGHVLRRRAKDRSFIDEQTAQLAEENAQNGVEFTSAAYQTVLGKQDGTGRVVIGPRGLHYTTACSAGIAPLPKYVDCPHVTNFGPPDTQAICKEAMNCFQATLPLGPDGKEPAIIEELVGKAGYRPMWGADVEDSKTPLGGPMAEAAVNLNGCFNGTFTEKGTTQPAVPIKRIPGLALPSLATFVDGQPVALHLHDLCIHLLQNYQRKESLIFYVPKLETEEEGRYVRKLVEDAEHWLKGYTKGEYQMGSVRLIFVVENPRLIFRVNELVDLTYPYFAGASLGWHDFLASTARLFKEDPQYRVPVKADPNIVVKHVKASHSLIANVVGPIGGIKIGGMYGVLPTNSDPQSRNYQVVLSGFFRDIIVQMKRDLGGFWVAKPEFVRIGMAIVEAWKLKQNGDGGKALETLITASISDEVERKTLLEFINQKDIEGFSIDNPMYPRWLLAASQGESDLISNSDEKEVRYNVFQCVQYLAAWLSGDACPTLPSFIKGEQVLVLDDLATTERSRWEVWLEVYHGRFKKMDLLRIIDEEMDFIKQDKKTDEKSVRVKYDASTAKWYPIARRLMTQFMDGEEKQPVEFVTERLLIFTLDEVRESADPWAAAHELDPARYPM